MWKNVWRDRIVRALVAAALLLWVPSFPPFTGLWESPWFFYAAQASALAGAIGVCLWRLWERPAVERSFWRLVALALVCWMGVHLIEVAIDGNWSADLRLSLLGDSGYALLYLFLVLALELRPHADASSEPVPRLRTLALLGSGLFALGLYAYTVGVALAFDRASYASWVPSQFLYTVCDLYLGMRLASLAFSIGDPRWRATYSTLLAAVLGWLALDSASLLSYMEVLVNPVPEPVNETLWAVSPLVFALAARVSAPRPGTPAARAGPDEDFFRSVWGGPLLACAVFFALVHLHVLVMPASAAVSGPRHWVAFTVLLALLAMAVGSQRMLARENKRLSAEREAVSERVRLAQRLEALGRLTGGVAHDFNNVLQVIRMCAENLVAELGPDSPRRQHAQEIVLASERASGLTARLLSLVRDRAPSSGECDLNLAILRTVATLKHIIGEDIRIETELDPAAGTLRADASRFEHVLLNLGVNARDAMPGGGTIRVTTAARTSGGERWTELALCDQGVGMDAATRARIFEPFFTTKRAGVGTGLGLVLVKGFVDELGGRIEVESAPGKGTTFRLHLRTEPRQADSSAAVSAAPELDGSATVLLAEDEASVRQVISGYLRHSGFRVLEAADGVEALELLARERPDLVVTDLTMPRMGGVELAGRIDELFQDLPVVFVTGYACEELESPARARSWLQKPFSRAELAAHLRAVLTTLPARARAAAQRSPPGAAGAAAGRTASV